MKTFLKILFAAVFCVMTAATVQATMDRGIFTALRELWGDPWVRVTIYDAYFAFLTFFVWVAWRERSFAARAAWFVLIMVFGNLAISVYMLIQLFRLRPEEPFENLFIRKKAGA